MSNAAGRAKRAVHKGQVTRRQLVRAEDRQVLARQAAAKEEENAARMFLFREKYPRVNIVLTPDERIGVLADYLDTVVPGFDRAGFELAWEMFVSGRITRAEAEAAVFVARHEQAEREGALLDGVPLDGQTPGGGLFVPGGAT